jgi:hypothetical protein
MMWRRPDLLAQACPPVARRQPDRTAEDLPTGTGYVHAAVPQRLDPDDGREQAGFPPGPGRRIRQQPVGLEYMNAAVICCFSWWRTAVKRRSGTRA